MKRVFLLVLGLLIWPQMLVAATRLGLHFTQEELNCWKQRGGFVTPGSLTPSCGTSASGGVGAAARYRTAGDVQTNSPGDWDRIVANKDAFLANPTVGRWPGPTLFGHAAGAGCVAENRDNEPHTANAAYENHVHRLRDAAFYYRVTGDGSGSLVSKAVTEFLAFAATSVLDFSNTSIWCGPGAYGDRSPIFVIASWSTKLFYAYDYLGRAAFTSGQLTTMDNFFWHAADFQRQETENSMNVWWQGGRAARIAGTYVTTRPCTQENNLPYNGAAAVQLVSGQYNNRRSSTVRFAFMVGVYLDLLGYTPPSTRIVGTTPATLIEDGTLYAKEYVIHSIMPQGAWGDYNRVDAGDETDTGWNYTTSTLATVLAITDTLARTGDTSLYTLNSSGGVCNAGGTINDGGVAPNRTGQNKDLLFGMQATMKYLTDRYDRYFGTTGNADHRIDGRTPRNGSVYHMVTDTSLTQGNIYYQDQFVQDAYRRLPASGSPVAYPAVPTTGVNTPAFTGENGVYPGMLFMWGQLEGVIDPYTLGGGGDPTVPNAPVNLRVVSP